MTAILLADFPQENLHAGDTITILGWCVVGSLVHAVYRLEDGTVPALPIPASVLRVVG